MNQPAPTHVRTHGHPCACGRTTWDPSGICLTCAAQLEDEGHAAAEHHIELYGWSGDRWDLAAEEYDADEAAGMFDEVA